jgi:hypothetical protein
MVTEDTARRIADALERIAERLGPRAADACHAKMMPGERVFSATPEGRHGPGGVTTIRVPPISGGGGG